MAKIILNVGINLKDTDTQIDKLRQQFQSLASSLSRVKVDENFVSGIKALTTHYEKLAKTASSVILAEEKLKQAREKTFQQQAKTTAEIAKANRELAKQEEAQAKATEADVKAQLAKTKLANETIKLLEKEKKLIDEQEKLRQSTLNSNTALVAFGDSAVTVAKKVEDFNHRTKTASDRVNTLRINFDDLFPKLLTGAKDLYDPLKINIVDFEKLGVAVDKAFGNASILLVRTFVREATQLFGELSDTLVNAENRVIELQRVLTEDISDGTISSAIFDLAQRYGQTFDNVATLTGNFARAGYSFADSIKATESALLGMNVAELNATQASEGLIAIMSQFGKEASDLELIIDELNQTADRNPVTTAKLLTALQRTGSSAHNANASLEKTISVITALSAATARSGQNLGTAINSLIMYSQKSLDTFSALSPEVDAVVKKYKQGTADIFDIWQATSVELQKLQAKGGLGSALDLFGGTEGIEDLNSTLHDEVEDVFDQIDGIYNIANTYRKNYFIALLTNMDRVMKVNEEIQNAEEYSQAENEKYLSTYEAKLNTYNAKWQEFLNNEQGFLGFKKGLLDVGSFLIDVSTNTGGIVSNISSMATLIGGIVALVKANSWSKKIVEIREGIASLGVMIRNFRHGLTDATSEAMLFQSALTGVGLVAMGLSVVITVINSITSAIERAKRETIEQAEANRDATKKLVEYRDKLVILTSDSKEYKDVEEKISGLLGDKTKTLEGLTKGTDEYRKALKELTDQEIKEQLLREKQALRVYESDLTKEVVWGGVDINEGLFGQTKDNFRGYLSMQGVSPDFLSADELVKYWDGFLEHTQKAQERAIEALTDGNTALYEKWSKVWAERSEDVKRLQPYIDDYKNSLITIGELEAFVGNIISGSTIGSVKSGWVGADNSPVKNIDDKPPLVVDKSLHNMDKYRNKGGGGTGDDPYLTALKDAVTLRKSELTLMEHQDASYEEQIAKVKEIQTALHNQAEYMRSIGSDEASINALSSEWYQYEEQITKLLEEQKNLRKEELEDDRKLLQSRLTLMENQGKSAEEQIEVMQAIQKNLHDEAEYLRQIEASETDINALSSEWWDWQEKILKLYQETLETARELELDEIQKIIDSILNEIDLEEEQVNLAEKRLAITKAQKDLEDAIAQAKIDYVQTVLTDYLSALSDAQTLDDKRKAVTEARQKALTAQKEAQRQAIIDALEAERTTQEENLSLAEKQLAVEEARKALNEAENNRTTRVYNESTGMWEYQADAKAVQSAQEKLADAVADLDSYLEGEAWNELIASINEGTVTERQMLDIVQKWANLSEGGGSFADSIIGAYHRAQWATPSADALSSSRESVQSAVDNLNEYLKNEAIKELKNYIATGNNSMTDMQAIMNKWLAMGEGSEIYDWSKGVLTTVKRAIDSGKYDDTKVKSQIQSLESAVKGFKDYVASEFLTKLENIAKSGTASDLESLIKWARENGYNGEYLDEAGKIAGLLNSKDNINAKYDDMLNNPNAYGGIISALASLADKNTPYIDNALTASMLNGSGSTQSVGVSNGTKIIYASGDSTPVPQIATVGSTSNVDSHDITINGIPISADMARNYTLEELCRMMSLV